MNILPWDPPSLMCLYGIIKFYYFLKSYLMDAEIFSIDIQASFSHDIWFYSAGYFLQFQLS